MPMPTMSTGKFDTRVTIRSSVLIWDADSSSIVAVWESREVIIDLWFHYSHQSGFVLDYTKWDPHLIYEHDGENGLVDELGFAVGQKRAGDGVGQGGHLAQHVARNWDRVWQQRSGSEFNKFWLTGNLRLSSGWYWAELSCRHEWEPL